MALALDARLGTVWDRLVSVFGRLSARERWMLAGLGLVLLVFAAVGAGRWAGAERDRLAAARADLMVATQNRQAVERGGLDAFDDAQLRALSGWSEHGRSIWLARVKVEQRIVAAAADAGMASPEIQVAEGLEGDSAVPLLRAEVSAPDQGLAVVGLLRRLSEDPRTFVLDRIQRTGGDTPEVKLSLLFPVDLDAGPAPGASTP